MKRRDFLRNATLGALAATPAMRAAVFLHDFGSPIAPLENVMLERVTNPPLVAFIHPSLLGDLHRRIDEHIMAIGLSAGSTHVIGGVEFRELRKVRP